jgi:hypothetical protein
MVKKYGKDQNQTYAAAWAAGICWPRADYGPSKLSMK